MIELAPPFLTVKKFFEAERAGSIRTFMEETQKDGHFTKIKDFRKVSAHWRRMA